jgi:hypothetical protein
MRRVRDELRLHAEIEGMRHRLDGFVAAIGIAGIIRLAHAADEIADAAAIAERGGGR